MGLFDLPAPLLAWADRQMAEVLGPLLRVLLWGGLGAVLSMELYRILSPQKRIRALRGDLVALRRRLAAFDGTLADGSPLIGRMLALSLRQLWLVAPDGTVVWEFINPERGGEGDSHTAIVTWAQRLDPETVRAALGLPDGAPIRTALENAQ